MTSSYFNYKIDKFLIEDYDNNAFDMTKAVMSVEYYEDLFSPAIFLRLTLIDTEGILSTFKYDDKKFGLRGGERVSLKISQLATEQAIDLNETKNTYYIYKISNSSNQHSKEIFQIDLAPVEVFKNETVRVSKRYPEKETESDLSIDQIVTKILNDVLQTNKNKDIEPTQNSYSFYGNIKKPFTILTWLCPKSIPKNLETGKEKGSAGFLFYENKNGYHFRSLDTLISGLNKDFNSTNSITKYHYSLKEYIGSEFDNTRIIHPPVFEKHVNVVENMRIGMYSSVNYFLDLNTSSTKKHVYKLSESYNIMNHASKKNQSPKIPIGENDLENYPSRMMVKLIDNIVTKPIQSDPNDTRYTDNRAIYQSQSVARYNLAFSQMLNITIPLNLNLTVGDVIELEIGEISLEQSEQGLKDKNKSGNYLIKELCHSFSDNKGYTGLKLIRDSYGPPSN
jgi:hypothetical protein